MVVRPKRKTKSKAELKEGFIVTGPRGKRNVFGSELFKTKKSAERAKRQLIKGVEIGLKSGITTKLELKLRQRSKIKKVKRRVFGFTR